jgi:membrane-bound lytic murein transglycosylase D
VRINDLKKWNSIHSNTIRVGQRLNVWTYKPGALAASRLTPSIIIPPNSKTYTVQPGDTLWDISTRIPGISVEKIKSLNNLKNSKLQPGQKLIIG